MVKDFIVSVVFILIAQLNISIMRGSVVNRYCQQQMCMHGA